MIHFNNNRLIKYEKEKYSKIGVMPRYGNADSVQWFLVEPSCAFHLINCFENGDDEVSLVTYSASYTMVLPCGIALEMAVWVLCNRLW